MKEIAKKILELKADNDRMVSENSLCPQIAYNIEEMADLGVELARMIATDTEGPND